MIAGVLWELALGILYENYEANAHVVYNIRLSPFSMPHDRGMLLGLTGIT